ncbi:MAG: FAD-dependent monooxygenase [Planktomarina sp.]
MPDIELGIIGGGIAGLSTAVACQRAGIDAHVFEAAPAIKPLGTSLSLWSNAMTCLADWDLAEGAKSKGAVFDQVATRRPDGKPFMVQPLQDLQAEAGQPAVIVRRSDLAAILRSTLADDTVHLGHELTDLNGTELAFANGMKVTAKHVIAADGIWSPTRAKIRNDPAPKYSGYGAYLGLSSGPSFQDQACEYLGHDDRMGVFETGDDTRYWFYVANDPVRSQHARVVRSDEVLDKITHWPQPFQDLVKQSHDGIVHVAFHDRPVGNHWGIENVTLIGDAMHPYVPNLGQGGCQAIEDAHAVAAGLQRGHWGVDLQSWMHKTRTKRARYFYANSRKVGMLAQPQNLLLRMMRSVIYAKPMQGLVTKELRKQFIRPAYPAP